MKVLILSATVGGGHMAAAEALKAYISTNCPRDEVAIIDALEEVDHVLNKLIVSGYSAIVRNIPLVFSAMYKASNKTTGVSSLIFNILFDKSEKLLKAIRRFKPDVIISTHPFCAQMVSILKNRGKVTLPAITVITDYGSHQSWVNHATDAYIVAHEDMTEQLCKMGTTSANIYPFGIPVKSIFYKEKNKKLLLEQMRMDPQLSTILIMAGSMGVKDILKVYNDILQIKERFQMIVIIGKNETLYKRFSLLIKRKKITPRKYKPTKLIKYTKEVHRYMAASDLIITKPGGLTVSEAIASNLPMALFKAIPGQEEDNKKFLIENGMAVDINNASCKKIIENLVSKPYILEEMKQNCRNFDKSKSCENIIELVHRLNEDYIKVREKQYG